MSGCLPFFLAEEANLIDEGIRFNNLPPNYIAWFLIPLAIIVFSSFFYRRERKVKGRLRVLLTTLRCLALLFIILLLFEPYRQFRRIEEIRSMVTILVDESASMARADPYDQSAERATALRSAANLPPTTEMRGISRTELVNRILGPEGLDFVARCEEKHDVKILGYATGKPRPLNELTELLQNGPVTATGDALAQVLADPEIQAKPNTSIVLVGDGQTNSGTNVIDIARHAGENDKVPVHAIGVGDPNAMRDIELRFVRADEVVLKGNTMKLALTVRNQGFGDEWVTITVIDQQRRRWMAPKTKKLLKSDADQILEIDLVVDRPKGTYTLDILVKASSSEENTRNNSKKHTVTVKDDRLKVLYVDTLPRWEYRRLKNFLVRGEEAFETRCLLLSAEQSFVQEFTRAPGVKPIREFPQEFEELDAYDVLIFGDVDPALLAPTPSKLEGMLRNIQRFVDNGGGLAVITGEGWTPHAYVDTPLEELLPVDITNAGDGGPRQNYVDEWKPRLTAFGRTHPVMQLRPDSDLNRRIWEERDFGLMELRWWYPVRKPTPAAQVLAYHPDERNRFGNFPIFVTGTYGDGPVFFSAVDETWRWFYLEGPVDFNRFWGNVVRYLAKAHLYRGSKRFKLISSASIYEQGETVQLTAFVKDKNFEDSRDATQRVMLVAPGSKGRPLDFEKRREGEYTHSFKPNKFGRYEAWVVGEEGIAGTKFAPISFEVRFVDPERQNPAMNEDALREICDVSGGSYFRIEDAGSVFERLRADTTRQSSVTSKPLKSRAWLPLIFLLLLTAEWLIRKKSNMA